MLEKKIWLLADVRAGHHIEQFLGVGKQGSGARVGGGVEPVHADDDLGKPCGGREFADEVRERGGLQLPRVAGQDEGDGMLLARYQCRVQP